MLFQYNLYFVILSVTVIISSTVAFTAWHRRSTSLASKPFILMMLAIAGKELIRATRDSDRVALIIMDIDYFKILMIHSVIRLAIA
ncbi:hypothetical protein [uncultured Nostoc sp.]|uniref:hypothetical protein n=1 Tax=uncultured Nostoc sp. TaxID=340711 RepID=UPI0035CBE242